MNPSGGSIHRVCRVGAPALTGPRSQNRAIRPAQCPEAPPGGVGPTCRAWWLEGPSGPARTPRSGGRAVPDSAHTPGPPPIAGRAGRAIRSASRRVGLRMAVRTRVATAGVAAGQASPPVLGWRADGRAVLADVGARSDRCDRTQVGQVTGKRALRRQRGSGWRRGWDSNPRSLSTQRFSRAPPSTARPPLRRQGYRAAGQGPLVGRGGPNRTLPRRCTSPASVGRTGPAVRPVAFDVMQARCIRRQGGCLLRLGPVAGAGQEV